MAATLTVDAHWLVRGRAASEDESSGRQWAPLATVDHWHVMKLCIEGSLDRVGIQEQARAAVKVDQRGGRASAG